jgi:hypothetical protein
MKQKQIRSWVRRHRVLLVITGLCATTATLYADLFGFDDGLLAAILGQDTVTAAEATISAVNAVSQLKQMVAMARHLTDKNMYTHLVGQVVQVEMGNQFGETAGLQNALTDTNYAQSRAFQDGYRKAVAPTGDTSYLRTDTPGASVRMAELATVEFSDATVQSCAAAISQYNQLAQQNRAAQEQLTTLAGSGEDNDNSEVTQLNILVQQLGQQMAEMKNSGPLQTCQAQARMVNMMDRRNQIAASLQFQGEMAAQPSTHLSGQSTLDALQHGWGFQAGEGQ